MFEYYDSDDEGEIVLWGRDRELQNAVSHSPNPAAARSAIAAGANINACDTQNGPIIVSAVLGGNEDIVRILLSNGADANARGNVVWGTALGAAAYNGNIGIVKLLLEHGAYPNGRLAASIYGPTPPLQYAAEGVKTDIVKLLLQYGADVNAVGGMYGTALQAACHYGYEPSVRALLEAGADVNLQGGYHGDALQAAARYGRAGLVQLLLDAGADPTAQCGVCGSALKGARERGHPEVAQMLEVAIERWKNSQRS